MHQPHPLKTFIIYASADRDLREELEDHLIPLVDAELLHLWSDKQILPGEEFNKAIETQLAAAELFVMLVSSSFFKSEYIRHTEFKQAIDKMQAGNAIVLPVIVKPCAWEHHPIIRKLQVLPHGGLPIVDTEHWNTRDKGWKKVLDGIATRIEHFWEEKKKATEAEARRAAEKAAADLAARRARDPFFEDMVLVEGGSFQMGSNEYDNEKPIHTVTVPSFYIGKYPVTQGQWQKVMGSNPSHFKGDERLPVEQVSWDDVQAFLKKLNEQTGSQYRLPSEAEWEYAARGGQKSEGYEYAGSNTLDEVGWYWENSDSKTHPIGQKKANELGLHDMSGNVWEWCEDDWHGNYEGAPKDGSAWVNNPRGSNRVLRGGSWLSYAADCRAAYRTGHAPTSRNSYLGFRLARSF